MASSSLGNDVVWHTLLSLLDTMSGGGAGSEKASTHFVTPYFPFVGKALLHISQQQGNKLNYFLLNTSYVLGMIQLNNLEASRKQ